MKPKKNDPPKESLEYSPHFSQNKLGLAIIICTLGFFLWMMHPLIKAISMGAIFAIVLYSVQDYIGRRNKRLASWMPLLLTIATVFLVLLPFVVITILSVQALQNITTESDFLASKAHLSQYTLYLQGVFSKLGIQVKLSLLEDYLYQTLQQVIKGIAGLVGLFFATIPNSLLAVFIFLLSLYFFLRDGEKFIAYLSQLTPFKEKQTARLLTSLKNTIDGVVLGSVVTGVVQSSLCLIAMLVFSIPHAFLLACTSFFMTFIPIIGIGPITVGSFIYLLIQRHFFSAIGMGVVVVLISVVDNVVRPWVQTSRTKIHPLLALLSVFAGLSTLGASGIFLGPVMTAMAVWVIETYTKTRPNQPNL